MLPPSLCITSWQRRRKSISQNLYSVSKECWMMTWLIYTSWLNFWKTMIFSLKEYCNYFYDIHTLCFYFAFSWPHQTFIECVKWVYWVLSSCSCFKTQILISGQGSTWRRVSHWTIANASWPGTDCWPRLAHSQLWRPRTEVSVFLNPGKLWDHVTSIKGKLELKYINL